MKNSFLIFLKGILMGICDLIPGISGGSIAFITGIYSRLINSVKSFSFKLIYDFFCFLKNKNKYSELKKDLKNLDLGFLLVLILGILSAFIFGSNLISYLLENYLIYTLSFFIGLILGSCFIIFENIKNHQIKNIFIGFIGVFIGISFLFFIPPEIKPNLFYIFLGGFFSVSAMFLPGISGSFILLIMGIYEFMINIIKDFSENIKIILIFLGGAILGAFSISRIISYLFKKDRCKILYFLLGLVIGSLSIPLQKIFLANKNNYDIINILILFLIGIFLVLIIRKYNKKVFLED